MGDYKAKRQLISRDTSTIEQAPEAAVKPTESSFIQDIIAQLVNDRPSEHEAMLSALRKSERGNVAYSLVPIPIIEMIEARRKELKLGKKEYFYHLLREDGLPVPTLEELDARNRR
ncbi:hypothetical protein PsAD13_03677 [Pseudovibrio sp. Ad13]|uniref:hypothetical protein n=1 Tax=Pseudovibrio sp. Ad13 TaxID=989396 RepID=UPI0007AEA66B|nr:hypothetical protein [Pseudovibrio sp. Ad13]KZK82123.1 hypothetical protein PsAD13_03677 [Pseudovibrio sp. Ad13]